MIAVGDGSFGERATNYRSFGGYAGGLGSGASLRLTIVSIVL